MSTKRLIIVLALSMFANRSVAQDFVPNYDERKVPRYELPDPLMDASGNRVLTAETWKSVRRNEILELFRSQIYGRSPAALACRATRMNVDHHALQGKAVRREIDLSFDRGDRSLTLALLIYTPANSERSPLFLGLNFSGNHAVDPDPRIRLTPSWVHEGADGSTLNHRATDRGRGLDAKAWPVETIIERGYGLATVYYGDLDPDFDDGFENGLHGLFPEFRQQVADGESWGSIAAWAYGLSRVLDYLQTDALVDGTRVAVIGHSRLGKTALWAGANDERFKLTISNNSGCGGAALSRRAFGETVGKINRTFPHWFCQNHRRYNDHESALPIDQHQLIALIAPRAVYVASASEDQWADPRGEFLACVAADPVFRLLGTSGMGGSNPPAVMPAPDTSLNQGNLGYHLRTGKHELTTEDWKHYLNFADKHL